MQALRPVWRRGHPAASSTRARGRAVPPRGLLGRGDATRPGCAPPSRGKSAAGGVWPRRAGGSRRALHRAARGRVKRGGARTLHEHDCGAAQVRALSPRASAGSVRRPRNPVRAIQSARACRLWRHGRRLQGSTAERWTASWRSRSCTAKFTNRKDLVSRFSREARAMSHLTHPNTAKVFLYGQLEDNSCYIVMEHLDGKNLGQIDASRGPHEPRARDRRAACRRAPRWRRRTRRASSTETSSPRTSSCARRAGSKTSSKVLDFGLAKVTEREMQPGLDDPHARGHGVRHTRIHVA
jgi:hypothetical protein